MSSWNLFDYLVAAALLLIVSLGTLFIFKKFHGTKPRIILLALIVILAAAAWVELAVGLFNTPLGGN